MSTVSQIRILLSSRLNKRCVNVLFPLLLLRKLLLYEIRELLEGGSIGIAQLHTVLVSMLASRLSPEHDQTYLNLYLSRLRALERRKQHIRRLELLGHDKRHSRYDGRVENDTEGMVLAHDETDALAAAAAAGLSVAVVLHQRRGVERSRVPVAVVIALDARLGHVDLEHARAPLLPADALLHDEDLGANC